MMKQRVASRNRRRQGAVRPSAREITLPLPLRGLLVQAKTAQVSNMFAAELHNMRSNGHSLTLRPGLIWDQAPLGEAVIKRIPHEFGGEATYIEATASGLRAAEALLLRPFLPSAAWGQISNNTIIADGNGQPVRFDGVEFTECAFTTETTVIAPEQCNGLIVHQDRVFMWKVGGSLDFLYGDVGAVTGPMARFPLGQLGNISGGMLAMVSLTIDAGHGMNDVLCIITTTGQMVLYEGLDPSDANDWRLLGRISASRPLGANAITKVGSDAWMLTVQGPVSIGEAARSSVLALVSEISTPIAREISALVEAGPAEWQAFTSADGSMVVINHILNGVARQWIYYVESRSWATADYPALEFHNFLGKPQISTFDGRLATLRHSGADETITGRWVSSWFQAGAGGSVEYIKPTIISGGPLTVRVVVLSDNQDSPADIAEAEQTITLKPEESGGVRVTLSDLIPTDASGDSFQITLEITAQWAEVSGLKAAIGS